jgi:hypothetical protein
LSYQRASVRQADRSGDLSLNTEGGIEISWSSMDPRGRDENAEQERSQQGWASSPVFESWHDRFADQRFP